MDHLHFGHRHPLWHSLVALVVVLLWSTSSAAQHKQWPNSITISGTPPATVTAGQNYSFIPTVINPLGHHMVFTISQLPSWGSFNSNTGQLSGTPSSADVGTSSGIVIAVSSTWQTAQLPPFTIQVLPGSTPPPPAAPTISGTPATSVVAGNAYSFKPTASGPSGMTLTFSGQNLPPWAGLNSATGVLSGTPTSSNVGTYSGIIISVSDGSQSASLAAFSITVTSAPPPPAPTISGTPATSVVAGSAYSFTPSASGPSGMTLSYSVQNKPSWGIFSIASGQLSGTPTTSNVGTYSNIIISVSDGQASTALPAFSITVTSPPPPPPPPTGSATVNWAAPSSNTDGSPLTNLAGFTVLYGTSASSLNQSVQVAGAGQTSYTLSTLAAGTWYFGVKAYTTTGMQSAMSSVGSLNVQ